MCRICCALFAIACFASASFARSAPARSAPRDARSDDAPWISWGGNLNNTRSSFTERHISPANVSSLHVKWVFKTKGDVSATPTVQDGSVYAVDWGGGVYRIDAKTGKAIWSRSMPTLTGNSQSFSRTSPAIGGDLIVIGDQGAATVLALNKKNGDVVWRKVVDPLSTAYITNSPVISDGVVYVGVSSGEEGKAGKHTDFVFHFRGSVQALDLRTGAVLWKMYTVPEGYTGGSVWGSNFVVDHARHTLYVTTGNNYSVPPEVAECLDAAHTVEKQEECLSKKDYIDGVLALDLDDGRVKWMRRMRGFDTWQEGCIFRGTTPCPDPEGSDYDLGSGPNLIDLQNPKNGHKQILGAGQKSGDYWGLDPDTGTVLYGTQVGPGGIYGGIEWGVSTDNARVYVPIMNYWHHWYELHPSGVRWNGGSWSALDARTGRILWQTKVPGKDPRTGMPAGALAPTSEANGVVFGAAMSGYMVALDAKSGRILWQFQSGGSVVCGPSIVDGTVYWGSGYKNDPKLLGGKGNDKLYAFTVDR